MTSPVNSAPGEARPKLPAEWQVFLRALTGLFPPGRRVPAVRVHTGVPGDVSQWSDTDLTVLLEQSQRELDRQGEDLERVRGRVQYLLTLALGLLGLLVAGTKTIVAGDNIAAYLCWAAAMLIAVFALLGATTVVVGSKDLGVVEPVLLSNVKPPALRAAARAAVMSVPVGANTVATQITVFRDSVLLLMSAALLYATAWLIVAL